MSAVAAAAIERQQVFYVEETDTFGGEANYCWVNRYKVTAVNKRAAMLKVGRHTGRSYRRDWSDGSMTRYNVPKTCICAFICSWDDAGTPPDFSVKELT
jgi:hypothetical protein